MYKTAYIPWLESFVQNLLVKKNLPKGNCVLKSSPLLRNCVKDCRYLLVYYPLYADVLEKLCRVMLVEPLLEKVILMCKMFDLIMLSPTLPGSCVRLTCL